MKPKLSAALLIATAAMLAFAGSAGAVDGTIEINQAKVLASGGSFPYVISTPNTSYRLTGSLNVPTGKDGIDVSAPNVTIDLNGFSIVGLGSSSNTPIGINSSGEMVTVENGWVSGFGTGVQLGFGSILKDVHADNNFNGIEVGTACVVTGCTANSCGGTGIQCQATCTITDNTANYDSAGGITCGAPGSGNASVISGNTVTTDGVGIHCVGSSCLITGNIVSYNTTGIQAADLTTGYGGNVLYFNTTPILKGTSMGNNLCSGTAC